MYIATLYNQHQVLDVWKELGGELSDDINSNDNLSRDIWMIMPQHYCLHCRQIGKEETSDIFHLVGAGERD